MSRSLLCFVAVRKHAKSGKKKNNSDSNSYPYGGITCDDKVKVVIMFCSSTLARQEWQEEEQ